MYGNVPCKLTYVFQSFLVLISFKLNRCFYLAMPLIKFEFYFKILNFTAFLRLDLVSGNLCSLGNVPHKLTYLFLSYHTVISFTLHKCIYLAMPLIKFEFRFKILHFTAFLRLDLVSGDSCSVWQCTL